MNDAQPSRAAHLRRLRVAAAEALAEYGLKGARLTFIGLSENTTYRADVPVTAERFLLRLHVPDPNRARLHAGWSCREAESELSWLEALRRDTDLAVPEPLRTTRGELAAEVSAPGIGSITVSMTRWVDGRFVSGRFGPAHARKTGELMARLHRHVEAWELPAGFVRRAIDAASLEPRMASLRAAIDTGVISAEQYGTFERGKEHAPQVMARLGRGPEAWGLIHADLHEGNRIFQRGDARPIDFSYCGFGHFYYDIAGSLMGMLQRREFLDGYRSVRPLADDCQPEIEAFLVMNAIENMAWHAHTPAEQEGVPGAARYVVHLVDERLLKGKPLLFGSRD